MRPRACPDVGLLQRFLLGRLPELEAERVEAHLERCDDCFAAVQRMPARDPLLQALEAAAALPAPHETLEPLMARLCRIPDRAAAPVAPSAVVEVPKNRRQAGARRWLAVAVVLLLSLVLLGCWLLLPSAGRGR
jgi:anti-sigma factor RsiW